jgi:hypothetical protein
MQFGSYEKPDGWSVGQPEVLVAQETIHALGMPHVDYDSLTDLVKQIADGQVSTIKIHSIPDKEHKLGYAFARSKTMHVDAIASENCLSDGEGTVTVIAHEAQHIGDFGKHPFRSTLETLSADILYAGRVASKAAFPKLPAVGSRYEYGPFEKRAYAREADLIVAQHAQDILFPQSARTRRLLVSRQLTLATLQILDLDAYDKMASDYVKPKNWFTRLFS